MVDFTQTRRALAEYDRHETQRRRLRDNALFQEEFEFIVYIEHLAAERVRRTYMLDAGPLGDWAEVSLASVEDIRKVVWLHQPNTRDN